MIRRAYELSFTWYDIKSAFSKYGIWPLDSYRLLSASRPRTYAYLSNIIGVDELKLLFEENERIVRSSIIGDDARIDSSDYINTSKGSVLYPDRALQFACEQSEKDCVNRNSKELKAISNSLLDARRERPELKDIEIHESARWRNRSSLINMNFILTFAFLSAHSGKADSKAIHDPGIYILGLFPFITWNIAKNNLLWF